MHATCFDLYQDPREDNPLIHTDGQLNEMETPWVVEGNWRA